jgi:hypothetical protein
MVLSHRDDVCDHAKWAKALGCQRIIHKVGAAASSRDGSTTLSHLHQLALYEQVVYEDAVWCCSRRSIGGKALSEPTRWKPPSSHTRV